MGQVVIGNVKTEQVTFKNMGGAGRFRIVPEAHWPDFAMDAPTDRAVVGQFKVRGLVVWRVVGWGVWCIVASRKGGRDSTVWGCASGLAEAGARQVR